MNQFQLKKKKKKGYDSVFDYESYFYVFTW
jgi:hypothetical protein